MGNKRGGDAMPLYFNHLAELCFSPESHSIRGMLREFAQGTAPARVSELGETSFCLDATARIATESEAEAIE